MFSCQERHRLADNGDRQPVVLGDGSDMVSAHSHNLRVAKAVLSGNSGIFAPSRTDLKDCT
jgi:hypothetical protein